MALPKANKFTKNGVEFTSKVDRAQYTINELSRAALLDTGKLVRKKIMPKAKKMRGMRRSRRPYKAFQYWVRKRETDLIIGSKHNTWYGVEQEKGSNRQPRRDIIKSTVMENLDDIRKAQGQYLSAIEDENRALGLIRPGEDGTNDNSSD